MFQRDAHAGIEALLCVVGAEGGFQIDGCALFPEFT